MASRLKLLGVVGALAVVALVWAGATLYGGSAGWPSTGDALPEIAGLPFEPVVVDQRAGDVKLVGDIDGDGLPDLVLAGGRDDGLVWYRHPDWHATQVASPNVEFTTDGALGDVDGDGDLDVVVPDGPEGDNLVWFENPRPGGDPGDPDAWSRRVVGAIGDWGKDVELADVDADGRLDVATRSAGQALLFFQTAAGFAPVALKGVTLGDEGLASGDIDGDGDVDLVVRGEWVENPGGTTARDPAAWRAHPVGDASGTFKALVADLDQDGRAEILYTSSEGVSDVVRYVPETADPRGDWRRQVILPDLERAHTLQAADLDADGDLDLVVAQMHTAAARRILALYNVDGQAGRWVAQVVDDTGLHNGVVADVGADGDADIFGANWLGNPPVRLWVNPLNPPPDRLRLDRWTYLPVSEANTRAFGLAFGDVDRDGRVDILSGEAWWRNPGGDLSGTWARTPLAAGMDAIAILDVDGDQRSDVIAQQGGEGAERLTLVWLEALDGAGSRWRATPIGTVAATSHAEGAQGYRVAQIEPGGRPEIALSSGAGVYYFRIPDQPEAGDWPRVHVAATPSDEGFAIGDVDGDGLADVAATGGETKAVAWYRNPGDGSGGWREYPVGRFDDAVYPDRTELADLDGDGRLDVIVSEENGAAADAQVYWWRAPEEPMAGAWSATQLASGASFNSMGVGDLDRDGDVDVVLGEHRGEMGLYVLNNLGGGRVSPQLLSLGRESHLGARPVDLDGDGDLDIVSIAWDSPGLVHLWRNDAVTKGDSE